MRVFVDTNVLVYARDASEPKKQPLARHWLDRLWSARLGALSTQVLNEYYVTVTRKLRPGLPLADARADVTDLLTWGPVAVTAELVSRAFRIEDRFELSYWDALIVAAAHASNSGFLLTEDLQDGQDLDGVVVVNPFNLSPEAVIDA